MTDCIQTKKSNCKNCHKCIRECPVKAIRFQDNQAYILKSECIMCGKCYTACPQNAKVIRDDLQTVKDLVKSGVPVYASVAPAFVADFKGVNITELEKALKKLGFAGAGETAVGATIVKDEYERILRGNDREVVISSCCHSVNTLIQKYYPNALQYLAKVLSPMQAHCTRIKEMHPEAKTVFIGPCVAKKDEADLYPGIVDGVLTFIELKRWMDEEGVTAEPTHEKDNGGRARLFPTTGGILRTMATKPENYSYMAIDGVENCMAALEDVISGKITKCFIEMSACPGSCVGGPAMNKHTSRPVEEFLAVDRYADDKDFDTEPMTSEQLKKDVDFINTKRQMPGERAIADILKKMGKTRPEDELNCGSCGYNTCREKAVAVYFGKASITMCLPYLIQKVESFSDTIIKNTPNGIMVLSEDLTIQQINSSARRIMNIARVQDVIGEPVVRILDPLPYMQVLNTGVNVHDKRIYLAEYDKYVEETILYDKSYNILISIMRDVTAEEQEKEQKEKMGRNTVEIADKVIEKQMRVVQEIASLLGETTAETKIALTKLKESLSDE
ncbi:MAG: [Fe-Fe] hydrogenase large subunit C-terminal domain-containing protein [Acutalibacteraceae bacterium]